MGLFETPLDGFSVDDFDVYKESCWSSNLHNLQRMKTKEKLLTLVKKVGGTLDILGTSIGSSSEIPSVWNGRQVKDQLVFYSRDKEAQRKLQTVIAREFDLAERIKAGAEHERHLILFARINAQRVSLGLRFTRYSLIDNRNLSAQLEANSGDIEQVITQLARTLTLEGESFDASRVASALQGLIDGRLEVVELSKSLEREAAIDLGADIEAVLSEALISCRDLFTAALWSETNDQLDLSKTLEDLSRKVLEREEQTSQNREAKQEAHAARAAKARERTEAKLEAEQAWRKLQRVNRTERVDETGDAESPKPQISSSSQTRSKANPEQTKARPKGQSRATNRPARTETQSKSVKDSGPKKTAARKKSVGPSRDWAVGDECTLSRGLFMGKRGQIVSAPEKGYVKVKVGVIEVNVSLAELEG